MIAAPAASQATPDEDLKSFKNYYHKKFPNTPKNDFINGVYSIDKASRAQWEEFEEFPSYEIFIDKGEELFNKKFANGKGYANCFPNHNKGIKQNYPYFDTKSGEVVTLEGAINKCRTDNGEKPLGWKKGKMTHLGAYLPISLVAKRLTLKCQTTLKQLLLIIVVKNTFTRNAVN